MGDHSLGINDSCCNILRKLNIMNGFSTSAVLACAFASASAFFYDPSAGVFTGTALSLNGGNALALSSGTAATAYLTFAGIGAAVVKMALLANAESRHKRSTVEDLAEIDNYFENIAAMDVDDCGKLFVCQLEAVPAEERSVEEQLIANLFGESSTIDPAQAKAEYDLAAYLGQATHSKVACARRYQRCPVDRKTIAQALAKMARQPAQ